MVNIFCNYWFRIYNRGLKHQQQDKMILNRYIIVTLIVIIIVIIQLSRYADIKITNEAKAAIEVQSEVKYSEVDFESSKKN